MADAESVSVSITPEMAAAMRDVVASGEYASVSELMGAALREWADRRARREEAVEELRQAWDVGIASGRSLDGEEVFARLRDRLREKINRRGAA